MFLTKNYLLLFVCAVKPFIITDVLTSKIGIETKNVNKKTIQFKLSEDCQRVILCYESALFNGSKNSGWKVARRFHFNAISNEQNNNNNCDKNEREIQLFFKHFTFSIGNEFFNIGRSLSELTVQLSSVESPFSKILINDETFDSKIGTEFSFQIKKGAFLDDYVDFWLMGVDIAPKFGKKSTKISVITSANCEFRLIEKDEPQKCYTFDNEQRFGRHINPLISGGSKIGINHVPWNVKFIGKRRQKNGKTSDVHCGGTLISTEFVLLAAHCLQNITAFQIGFNSSSTNDMKNGAHGGVLSTTHQRHNNSNVFIHPKYLPNSDETIEPFNMTPVGPFDLALIKLNCALRAPIFPVCIHCGNAKAFRAGTAFISGWGQQEDDCKVKGYVTTSLMGRFVQLTRCIYKYDRHICTKGVTAQKGDSGGALLASNGTHFVQVGVLAGGLCHWLTETSYLSIYSPLDGLWIEEITGIKCPTD